MESDPLEALLERLSTGDDAAAAEVFRAYEPYLRMVVRRMLPNALRQKFDSVDVVQSVWADVLTGFREAGWRFPDAAHLKAFLVRATKNRFIDRVRTNKAALAHQQPLSADYPTRASVPDADKVVAADELWEKMLALCAPNHRPILTLKRDGCSLAEIAEKTGFHESSVRRILYDLARRLALANQTPPE